MSSSSSSRAARRAAAAVRLLARVSAAAAAVMLLAAARAGAQGADSVKAPAQGPPHTYTRWASDTLRYHVHGRNVVDFRSAQGRPIGVAKVDNDGTIGWRFGAGDSASAWYESLTLRSQPLLDTVRTVDVSVVLRQPFSLLVDRRGAVKMLAHPTILDSLKHCPPSLVGALNEMLLRLPTTPLRVGLAWADTVAYGVAPRASGRRVVTTTRYRVERDTTIGEYRALVVTGQRHVVDRLRDLRPGLPTTDLVREGDEKVTFWFAPEEGMLLATRTEGEQRGDAGYLLIPGSLDAFKVEMTLAEVRHSYVVTASLMR